MKVFILLIIALLFSLFSLTAEAHGCPSGKQAVNCGYRWDWSCLCNAYWCDCV